MPGKKGTAAIASELAMSWLINWRPTRNLPPVVVTTQAYLHMYSTPSRYAMQPEGPLAGGTSLPIYAE